METSLVSNEELKRRLAKLLWESGFGDDPWRNWRMAELMIIDDGFLAWRRQALTLKAMEERGAADSFDYDQLLSDFLNGIAYWVYATSLALSCPSHDAATNWRIAESLKNWFCAQEF